MKEKTSLLIIGPGLLVAATGVGAGDLATGAFAGNQLGVAILWAVLLGAFFKYVLNEGIARWQFATGSTYIDGLQLHLGKPFKVIFLVYLCAWSYFVGAALISACGVTAQAILPLQGTADGKVFYGIGHSLAGLVLVLIGGFSVFDRLMKLCIAVMLVTVLFTASMLVSDTTQILNGLLIPRIPYHLEGGFAWTIALIGGVGGTVTILCYSYWLQESSTTQPRNLRESRVDLAVAYFVTALFGLAMVVIGSVSDVDGKGVSLIVAIADRLMEEQGNVIRWLFLIGAWGAMFSSLLGVWQCVPNLFCDVLNEQRNQPLEAIEKSRLYRGILVMLATIPLIGLFASFREVQKIYSVAGAAFLPFLALTMLILNNKKSWIGEKWANSVVNNFFLVTILLFFILAFGFHLKKIFF